MPNGGEASPAAVELQQLAEGVGRDGGIEYRVRVGRPPAAGAPRCSESRANPTTRTGTTEPDDDGWRYGSLMGDETLCKRCQKAPRALGDGQTMCSRCLEDASMRAVRDDLHQVPLGDHFGAVVESEGITAMAGDLVLMWLYRALAPAAPSRPRPEEATIMADLEHADLEEADAAISRFLGLPIGLPGEPELWSWRPITISGRPSLVAWHRVEGYRQHSCSDTR